MAGEGTYLLPSILLLLLAPGSWAQEDTEVLQALEGKAVSVTCQYHFSQRVMAKGWCREMSDGYCRFLVSSLSPRDSSKYSIQDHPEQQVFTIWVTELKVKDTGIYHCGVYQKADAIAIIKTVYLVVTRASILPTAISWTTTAPASMPSPDTDSPLSSWTSVAGTVVAVLLLLAFAVLVALYLRKAKGSVQKEENESYHIHEGPSDQKEESPGFDQPILSEEDSGTICYASLVHLTHVNPPDPVYSNTRPHPLLSVEYTSVSRSTPGASASAALEAKPRK